MSTLTKAHVHNIKVRKAGPWSIIQNEIPKGIGKADCYQPGGRRRAFSFLGGLGGAPLNQKSSDLKEKENAEYVLQ